MWVKDGETSLTCPEKKKPNMFGNKTKSNWCGYVSLCSRWKHALNYLFCVTLWPLDQSGLNTFENKTKHRLFLYIYLYICEQQSGHKKYEQSLKWNKEMNSEQKLCIKYKLFNKLIIINKSTYKTINMHNFEKTKNYLGYKVSFWAGKGPSPETSRFRLVKFRKYKLCHIVFLLKVVCPLPSSAFHISEADDINTPKISQTVPHTRHRTAACSNLRSLSYSFHSVFQSFLSTC